MTAVDLADDPTIVDAAPTKAFFVDIITRDIQLDKAIQDLVDNCVDGAKRLRPGGDYSGLWVRINLSAESFKISDNCGGIPLDIARRYAFKFGRASGFSRTPFSVGQFGVGMKRALFKMGDHFVVQSVEPASKFEIVVDVPKWASEPSWDFRLSGLEEAPNAPEDTGTTITVTELDQGVAVTFASETFQSSLRQQIRITQQQFMRQGLQVFFQDQAIISADWQLVRGEGIDPSFSKYEDELGGTAPLRTRIYAGVGASSSSAHAGWYVFCNGRCILSADQTEVTGWAETNDEGVSSPKYHGQFARFRGYAFLDCEDASLLPWNTTKTALDLDDDAYRRLKGRLVKAMRPVIDFLNQLDAESDLEEVDRELTKAVQRAASTPLERLVERPTFVFRAPGKRPPPLGTISYKRLQTEIDELKEKMEVSSNRELGIRTFEYAYEVLVEN